MKKQKFNKQIDVFLNVLSIIGITTQSVSEGTGISVHSLSNWRQGKSSPNQSNLLKLKEYTLFLLTLGGLDFPVKREYRESLIVFYNQVEDALRDMPRTGKKEKLITSDHQNNPEAQNILKKFLDFDIFDMYFNTERNTGFVMDKKNNVDRKIQKKYRATFTKNFKALLDFIDETSQYEVDKLSECLLLPDNLSERLSVEFYDNLPHEEDFDVPYKISSVGELWLETKLDVSKTQIINWKKGRDFPSEENLKNLKKIVRKTTEAAFLGYEYSNDDFLNMFLTSPTIEADKWLNEHMYYQTLKYFANALCFYCGNNKEVLELQEDMKDNLINNDKSTIATSFINEIWNLKVSRKIKENHHNPELTEYIKMKDTEVEYILKRDYQILNNIFTSNNIKILNDYAYENFNDDQLEALTETIEQLKKNEGFDDLHLHADPRFRQLYHPSFKQKKFL